MALFLSWSSQSELERRENLYRGTSAPLNVSGRTVIIVDDGLATGSTMRAAVKGLKNLGPARIIVAAPVVARETCESFNADVDATCVCVMSPDPFDGVGRWYRENMKYFILAAGILFPTHLKAQTPPPRVSTPQHIVVDSKDNVFATLKYGIVKITPDGTVTNITKQAGVIGDLDRSWHNLIIDSKDNLYANDGNLIYKIAVTADNKAIGKIFAGQQYTYKLEDGPIATAGFNTIALMTIDKNDNIYLIDSYDKIKATIGDNFVTDSYYRNDPEKKYKKYGAHYSVIRKISANGNVSTLKTPDGKYVLPNDISGLTTDDQGNLIYAAYGFARFIGKIDLTTGSFSSIAGQPYKREWCPVYTQGESSKAEFVSPETIISNKKGEIIFTDQRLHRVIKVSNGKVSTLAGNNIIDPCAQNIGGRAQEGYQDGKSLTALFNFPKGITYDSKGNLFIADMNNHCIRKLSPDGVVTTFAK